MGSSQLVLTPSDPEAHRPAMPCRSPCGPKLLVWLDCKQRPDSHVTADALRLTMVRSHRAGWLVIPMSAERNRDHSPRGARLGGWRHDQFRLMGKCLAHESSMAPLPFAVAQLARKPPRRAVPVAAAPGRHRARRRSRARERGSPFGWTDWRGAAGLRL